MPSDIRSFADILRRPEKSVEVFQFIEALKRLRVIMPAGEATLLQAIGASNMVLDLRNITARGQDSDGLLPPQEGNAGRSLFTNGSSPFWGDGGDVFGPAVSALTNVAIFDALTGKHIADSGVPIADLVGGRIASEGFTDVQKLSTQGVGNGSGDTVLTLDSVISNDFGIWNGGQPSRFTLPTSGIWLFTGRIDYFQNATGARLCYIRRNGTGIEAIQCSQAVDVSGGGLATIVPIFGLGHFTAGDYLELIAQQWSGAGLNVTYARMQAVRIDVSNVPGGGGGADLSTILVSAGDVVCSGGEVVWSTPP